MNWTQRLGLLSAALGFVSGVLLLMDGQPYGYVMIAAAPLFVFAIFHGQRRHQTDSVSGESDQPDLSRD